jgi:V8-like Glu-specific endopeptidase
MRVRWGVREIGGFEIGPYDKKLPGDGEVSMGGDSGSLWLLDDDGPASSGATAVGLHFAGESDPAPEEEHAVACNIHSVLDKLQVSLVRPPSLPLPEADSTERRLTCLLRRVESLERQLAQSSRGSGRSSAPRPERVFGPDDRQWVPNKSYPYNTICSLLVNHNGKESIGSGWLVHPRVILTCAHVLRNKLTRQLPNHVDIWAGRFHNSRLNASAGDLFNFVIHPAYSGKDVDEFDVGAILLSEPILAPNQIILLRSKSEAQLKSATLEIAGYPKFVREDQFDGEELFWAEGPASEVFPGRFEYTIDTSPGQSGSPVLYYEAVAGGTKCFAVGIHSDGPENAANSAVRIRPDVINEVNRWIARVEAN